MDLSVHLNVDAFTGSELGAVLHPGEGDVGLVDLHLQDHVLLLQDSLVFEGNDELDGDFWNMKFFI